MAPKPFAVTNDQELETAVRDKTSYDSNPDELPGDYQSGQFTGIVEDAKRVLYMRTKTDDWYSDLSYGQALVALTAMKAKAAVENVNIQSYGIGDESLSFTNADPETSQQIQAWSSEVSEGIDQSEISAVSEEQPRFSNTASYIG